MEPGSKMDYTLILEGEQGTGKSTVCEILGRRKEWFAVARPDIDKDAKQLLSMKWLIEFAEIDALGKREASMVKNFMSTATDTYRPPYAKAPSAFPRQSIFIGTVNPGASYDYLNDGTGGRRYWPVETGDIDTEALKEDVEQLYAEAMHRYNEGEKPFVKASYEGILAEEVGKRQVIDPIVELVEQYIQCNPEVDIINIRYLGISVCNINPERFDVKAKRKVVEALKYLGWKITGKNKINARPIHKVQASKFEGIRSDVQALRKTLKRTQKFTYTYLARRFELGPLDASMRQKLGKHLRELEGVETQYDHDERQSYAVFKPWAHLEDGDI
jgi:predicted P-loop ATPase